MIYYLKERYNRFRNFIRINRIFLKYACNFDIRKVELQQLHESLKQQQKVKMTILFKEFDSDYNKRTIINTFKHMREN